MVSQSTRAAILQCQWPGTLCMYIAHHTAFIIHTDEDSWGVSRKSSKKGDPSRLIQHEL